ncbi:MAG: sigma-54 dependent transcriptional regulator [Desulfobacteraceae bacterium]|jgi:two-component system response regulator AtoC|nr:sigma-54 dependent transcriptional regulator [Desulfobacteraceae bacterium]
MKILVVDDEEIQRELLRGFLEKQGYDVTAAADGHEALNIFSRLPFQLVLLDHRMPGMSGDQVLMKIKEINPLVRSIMITAFGSVDTAVTVMKLGADDFLEKPVDLSSLLEKIQRIEQTVMIDEEAANVSVTMDEEEFPIKVVGDSHAMKEVFSLVRRIAPTDWTVLIRGETGTGKELIARIVHLLSPRNEKPFIEVNCAAIPENLFESEVFGHEKGAFTGAVSSRKGRFELAQNGSLFLDEVGELPLNLQAKLLRALQEKKISRVGSEKDIPIDVRVLAATNRDLRKMVENGEFREDLFYRLNVLDIEIPPLRHRKEDVPALTEFFLERYNSRADRFDSDAMTTLIKYSFPGNVRELEHMIQRTLTLSRGTVIRAGDLPAEVRFHQAIEQEGSLAKRLEAVEREMMISALEKHDWIQTRAADTLGISERMLRYKLKKYRIKNQKK